MLWQVTGNDGRRPSKQVIPVIALQRQAATKIPMRNYLLAHQKDIVVGLPDVATYFQSQQLSQGMEGQAQWEMDQNYCSVPLSRDYQAACNFLEKKNGFNSAVPLQPQAAIQPALGLEC